MRNSVAHEEVGAWSRSTGGENVPEGMVDGAGSEERSAVKSNDDWAVGGVGETLWLAEKKRAASSPKLEGTGCVVRNTYP